MKEAFTEIVESALVGATLQDTYRVEELVGTGGMAWVYRASHLRLGGEVAIKILFSNLARDTNKRDRFLREARIQHRLNHPNIVRVSDIIEQGDLSGFVMEWCNSGTLLHMLQKANGPLSNAQLSHLFPMMVDALGYAHAKDVVHRDLKPQNILLHVVEDRIEPKIADFGIAKTVGELGLTRTGEVMGTLEYASPEQLKDSKSVNHRSDIYNIGVLLYRMATGRLPFHGSPARLIKQVLHQTPPAPVEAPKALHSLILKCLEKNPEDRFSSCYELREAFLALSDVGASSDNFRAPLSKPASAESSSWTKASQGANGAIRGVLEGQLSEHESSDSHEVTSFRELDPANADQVQRSVLSPWWTKALFIGITLTLVVVLVATILHQ